MHDTLYNVHEVLLRASEDPCSFSFNIHPSVLPQSFNCSFRTQGILGAVVPPVWPWSNSNPANIWHAAPHECKPYQKLYKMCSLFPSSHASRCLSWFCLSTKKSIDFTLSHRTTLHLWNFIHVAHFQILKAQTRRNRLHRGARSRYSYDPAGCTSLNCSLDRD